MWLGGWVKRGRPLGHRKQPQLWFFDNFRFRFLSDGGGSASASLPTFSKISFWVIFVTFLRLFCYIYVYCVFLVWSCVKTCANCWVVIVFSYRVSLRPTLLPICVHDLVCCIFYLSPSVFSSPVRRTESYSDTPGVSVSVNVSVSVSVSVSVCQRQRERENVKVFGASYFLSNVFIYHTIFYWLQYTNTYIALKLFGSDFTAMLYKKYY